VRGEGEVGGRVSAHEKEEGFGPFGWISFDEVEGCGAEG